MAADVPKVDALYADAPCGLIVTEADGGIRHVNRTFCGWTGYEAAELVGAKRIQDLLTVGGRIFHQTHWVPLLRMQGAIAEVKLELRHRDGRTLPIVMNAVSRSHDGHELHELAIFVAEDRHRYERELVREREQAQQLLATYMEAQQALASAEARLRLAMEASEDRARFAEQMVGIVSHDLRNPLTAIKMGMQMLASPTISGEKRERVFVHMEASVERARQLTNDLLDFTQAKIGSGLSVAPKPINVHRVVGEAVHELRMSFFGRRIVHVEEGEGVSSADPHRLTQLLGNLVGNAMAYGSPDHPVTITTRVDAEHFVIEVHNWGTPIAASLLPVLFEPMTRGIEAGGERRSVGLGLFIVKDIMRAHGGRIAVCSDEASGTVFEMVFSRHGERIATG